MRTSLCWFAFFPSRGTRPSHPLEPRQLFAELACLQVGAISCRRFYLSRMSLFRGFLQSNPYKTFLEIHSISAPLEHGSVGQGHSIQGRTIQHGAIRQGPCTVRRPAL